MYLRNNMNCQYISTIFIHPTGIDIKTTDDETLAMKFSQETINVIGDSILQIVNAKNNLYCWSPN